MLFNMALDCNAGILRIKMTGHWTLDTVAAYQAERKRQLTAAHSAGFTADRLRLLVDRRDQTAQSQAVVEAMRLAIADNAAVACRTAVLVTSVLHKRQIDRTANSAAVHVFDNETNAREWLG